MRQDEIKNRQFRADVFHRMFTAIAEIFPSNGAIHKAREKMVDASVSKQQPGGGMSLQEASLVLGVTEAKEVLDAGFRKVHGSQTQYGGHDLPVVPYSAKTSCVLRPGVDLKAGTSLFR